MNLAQKVCQVLLLCSLAAPASAQTELERTLFTSPEQRAYLDYLRQDFLARSRERGFDIGTTDVPTIPTADAAAVEAAPVVHRLGGIVTLRDGTQRIWLNGLALTRDELPDGFSIARQDGAWLLNISHAGRSYQLKPGQSVELGSAQGPRERYALSPEPRATNSIPATAVGSAAGGEALPSESLTASIMALSPAEMEELIEALERTQADTDADDAAELEDDDEE